MKPCSFTPQHYLDTLNSFLDLGYHIGPVSDYFQHKIYNKHILLRHDVDFSLDHALDMALLEKDNGVQATYYIQVRCDLYNALSSEGERAIYEIHNAGHEIGLHIDSRSYKTIDFEILAALARQNISQWSKHLYTITPDPYPVPEYGNNDIPLKNGYQYLADSAMSWRNGCFCECGCKQGKLQILIHPEWWMTRPSGEANRWEVLEILEEAARQKAAAAFMDFREILRDRTQECLL